MIRSLSVTKVLILIVLWATINILRMHIFDHKKLVEKYKQSQSDRKIHEETPEPKSTHSHASFQTTPPETTITFKPLDYSCKESLMQELEALEKQLKIKTDETEHLVFEIEMIEKEMTSLPDLQYLPADYSNNEDDNNEEDSYSDHIDINDEDEKIPESDEDDSDLFATDAPETTKLPLAQVTTSIPIDDNNCHENLITLTTNLEIQNNQMTKDNLEYDNLEKHFKDVDSSMAEYDKYLRVDSMKKIFFRKILRHVSCTTISSHELQ